MTPIKIPGKNNRDQRRSTIAASHNVSPEATASRSLLGLVVCDYLLIQSSRKNLVLPGARQRFHSLMCQETLFLSFLINQQRIDH